MTTVKDIPIVDATVEGRDQSAPKNIYSYTYLAGRLEARADLSPSEMDQNPRIWQRHKITSADFASLIKTYYPSHLRAMTEIDVEGIYPPDGLTPLRRYDMSLDEKEGIAGPLMLLNGDSYPCRIENVSVWFFPFDMVLFSIRIDDSGTDLDKLTLQHSKWKAWGDDYDVFHTKRLDALLSPLAALTPSDDIRQVTHSGTKIRQYQVIQTDRLDDNLLFEVATFSKIGVVADKNPRQSYKPSTEYLDIIMQENIVSVYSNWKALALNDSYTVLALDDYYAMSEHDTKAGDGYFYFDLLYMRCLLQVFYCFSLNNRYREGNMAIDVARQEHEIAKMEMYYFFDDLSYDFLPSLVYRSMAKGMGLPAAREELVRHIKQALRERRREREERVSRLNNMAAVLVQIFALLSVGWTVYEFLAAISPCRFETPLTALLSLIISAVALVFIILTVAIYKRRKSE